MTDFSWIPKNVAAKVSTQLQDKSSNFLTLILSYEIPYAKLGTEGCGH